MFTLRELKDIKESLEASRCLVYTTNELVVKLNDEIEKMTKNEISKFIDKLMNGFDRSLTSNIISAVCESDEYAKVEEFDIYNIYYSFKGREFISYMDDSHAYTMKEFKVIENKIDEFKKTLEPKILDLIDYLSHLNKYDLEFAYETYC